MWEKVDMSKNCTIGLITADDKLVELVRDAVRNEENMAVAFCISSIATLHDELRAFRPSIIIMDCMFPGGGSVELLRCYDEFISIHNLYAKIPLIFIGDSVSDIRNTTSGRMNPYFLVNPINRAEIISIIDMVIKHLNEQEKMMLRGQKDDTFDGRRMWSETYNVLEAQSPKRSADTILHDILVKEGICENHSGFYYLKTAILLTMHHEERLLGLTKGLLREIGDLYGKEAHLIDGAIRKAIKFAWDKQFDVDHTKFYMGKDTTSASLFSDGTELEGITTGGMVSKEYALLDMGIENIKPIIANMERPPKNKEFIRIMAKRMEKLSVLH